MIRRLTNQLCLVAVKTMVLLTALVVLSACHGGGGSNRNEITDSTDASAAIQFPPPRSLIETDRITVRGIAADEVNGVAAVEVNGVSAKTDDGFRHWSAEVPLAYGSNSLVVSVTNSIGNTNKSAAEAIVVYDGVSMLQPVNIALDSINNRALVVDADLNALLSIDLSTGVRKVISGDSPPNTDNPLTDPRGIALDGLNNRVLVLARSSNIRLRVSGHFKFQLISVDLNTGVRRTISGNSSLNTGNPFFNPRGIVLDSLNNRVLVMDSGINFLLAVDLSTGELSVVVPNSDPNTPNLNNNRYFVDPTGIALDNDNNRILVTDDNLNALISVDLGTGIPHVISNNSIQNDVVFVGPKDVMLDRENNRALVMDTGQNALLSVDLDTGVRRIISDSSNAAPDDANQFDRPTGLVLDNENNRVLVINSHPNHLLAIDLDTGERTFISGNRFQNSNFFVVPDGLALDRINHQAIITDPYFQRLLSMDLRTGNYTIVSDSSTPNNINAFDFPTALALDSENQRALVIDEGLTALLSVDLITGERNIISDSNIPDDTNAFRYPTDMALDSENNRVLVLDGDEKALLEVNLNSGKRTVISNNGAPDDNNLLMSPRGLVLDSDNHRALIVDPSLNALLSVDLHDGKRTIISDETIPDSLNLFNYPVGLALDTTNNRVLIADSEQLLSVDLKSGGRSIIWNHDGFKPYRIGLDSVNNNALITGEGFQTGLALLVILVIDLETGEHVIIFRNDIAL